VIEVYFIKKKRLRLEGYLNEQKQVLTKNGKMQAYVKENKVYFWTHELIYTLNDDTILRSDGEIEGYLFNGEISNYDRSPYIRFNRQTGEVEHFDGFQYEASFVLKGDLTQVDDPLFLAFCFWFLDFGR